MISQLAVFKDVIPGYRIRPLTDAEKMEKIGQMVRRTREWEQGLVSVYQTYLQALGSELKGDLRCLSSGLIAHYLCNQRNPNSLNWRLNRCARFSPKLFISIFALISSVPWWRA